MIDDADLLQANATVIAGILIFLTVSPVSRGTANELKERRGILISTYFTLSLFVGSIILLLLPFPSPFDVSSSPISIFLVPKMFFFAWTCGFDGYNLVYSEEIAKVRNKSKQTT